MSDTREKVSEQPAGPTAGRPPRVGARRSVRYGVIGIALTLMAAAGVGSVVYEKLKSNIRTDRDTARLLADPQVSRPPAAPKGAQNVLIMGSDLRTGEAGERSDTVMLMHVAGDGSRATVVSVPRDLMVNVPNCERPSGGEISARFVQFNWAFELAGASCTIRTFEQLTGIRVDHHIVLHFEDFKRVIDAVGGVRMCLPEPEQDVDVGLSLPAGCQVLRGDNALAYVRARKGIADGSDTHRMDRQQAFLATVARQLAGNGLLGSPVRLYSVLDSVTSALTTDPGLASPSGLYSFADSIRSIPTDRISYLTVPRQPYPADPNRDELLQPAADELFRTLREDRPTT